jgi:hypothetical protein
MSRKNIYVQQVHSIKIKNNKKFRMQHFVLLLTSRGEREPLDYLRAITYRMPDPL